MQFRKGQTVIHPHHGPATVTQAFERPVGGGSRRYVRLAVHRGDLSIAVPVDRADEVGVRPVYDEPQLQQLREVLCGPSGDQEENWSHRFKANQEKLKLGNLLATAEVVRDLTRRQEQRGLSTGEKHMLRYARGLVLAELALSLSLTDEEVEARLDAVVLGTAPVAG